MKYQRGRNTYNKMLAANVNEMELLNSVKLLSKLLYNHYGKPVMLFIDEYDVPIQSAYIEKYYEQAIKFLKAFYGSTFKDNPYLEKTVINRSK